MSTNTVTVYQLSNIQTMILQGIKKREISMSSIALEYRPTETVSSEKNQKLLSSIKATAMSVDKLKLISDFSKVVDITVIQELITDDKFDKLSRAEILDELIAASA